MRSNATSETSSKPSLTARLLRLSATQASDSPAPLPAVDAGLHSGPRAHSLTPAAASPGVGDQSSPGSPPCADERADVEQQIQALLTDHCAELQAAAQREHNPAEEHEHCLRQYGAGRGAMLAELEGTRVECQQLAELLSEHEAARHAAEQCREDVRGEPQEATRQPQADHDGSIAEHEATQAELERTRADRERLDAAYRDLQLAHQLAKASWCAEREAFEDRHNTLVARYEAALHIAHQSVDQLRTLVTMYRAPHERI